MITAEILFACAWAIIKWAGSYFSVFEVVFFRATLSLAILIPFMIVRGSSFKGKNNRLLLLRSLFGFLGVATSFTAMIYMNLGNASVLLNTFPLFVAILAPLLINEKFRRLNFIFVIVAFAGIWMLTKPTRHIFQDISLLGLMSGIFAALSVICVRRLTLTDSSAVITLYFTAFTAIASIPFAIRDFAWPTPFEWLLLIVMGTAVTAGQLLMTKAYSYGRAATLSPFAYISVVCAYIFGILLWNDIPDTLSVIGALLVISTGIGITISEGRAKPELTT